MDGITGHERVGGARADFVANLGRRVAELSTTLKGLEVDPASIRLRDEMRRRIHALSAGARLLRFTRLAQELADGERLLEKRAQQMDALTQGELVDLRALLECAPALAWGQASVDGPTPSGPKSGPAPAKTASKQAQAAQLEPAIDTQIVLVVGPSQLADAITKGLDEPGEASSPGAFEVERTEDCATAIDLARALAPDIALIDADVPGARELVTALLSDPLTEPVPVICIGTWSKPEDAAPFVALGCARALAKPVSPDAIKRACFETLSTYVRREVKRTPLGELTLDDLGARLSEEIHRGLCDAALKGRGSRIELGDGSDVLAAVWGAVARIRDLVTIHSEGAVRFSGSGPEGALPIAPWLGQDQGNEGRSARPSEVRTLTTPSLEGKSIVVADDDPAVTWFLTGILRSAGATVLEAHDGARALDLAFQHTPDLVVSDVLMPELDGFALCRALKRDLVLRDVPVILLSWKEDLLQRVRELGADADGYLRKEATAASIVQRVREVLRGRHRLAERLSAGGEVRGRLDGVTARTLLHLVCAAQPDSMESLRDATFLYEIEIREGRPARATRTVSDGSFQRGPSVLAALLGVGSGRFVVTRMSAPSVGRADLDGSLEEQLQEHVASARAAQRLLSAAALVHVDHVDLDESRMDAYAFATPEPARSLLRAIAGGASPRNLITTGQASARLVEDVLCDAAAHGAVSGVTGAEGEDLLFPAIEREVRILRGVRPAPAPLPEPMLDLGPVIHTSTPAPVEVLEAATPDPEIEALPVEEESEPPAPLPLLVRVPTPAPMPPVAHDEAKPPARPIVTLGSLTPPPVAPRIEPRAVEAPRIVEPAPEPTPEAERRAAPRPSSYHPGTSHVAAAPVEKPKKESNKTMWLMFAVAGIVFAVGARLSRDREAGHTAQPAAPPAPTVEATAPAPTSEPAELRGDGDSKADPILPVDSPLRADDKVPAGQGLLEIVAGTSDAVSIDGTAVGNGPIIKRALAPRKEPYEIRVKTRSDERVRFVAIREGRLTRLRVAPPWSR